MSSLNVSTMWMWHSTIFLSDWFLDSWKLKTSHEFSVEMGEVLWVWKFTGKPHSSSSSSSSLLLYCLRPLRLLSHFLSLFDPSFRHPSYTLHSLSIFMNWVDKCHSSLMFSRQFSMESSISDSFWIPNIFVPSFKTWCSLSLLSLKQ